MILQIHATSSTQSNRTFQHNHSQQIFIHLWRETKLTKPIRHCLPLCARPYWRRIPPPGDSSSPPGTVICCGSGPAHNLNQGIPHSCRDLLVSGPTYPRKCLQISSPYSRCSHSSTILLNLIGWLLFLVVARASNNLHWALGSLYGNFRWV